MKKWKKALSCVTAFAIVASLLVGCAPSISTETTSSQATSPSASTTPTEVDKNAPPLLPFSESGTTLSLSCSDNGDATKSYTLNLPVFQELEKLTGIKIDWQMTSSGDYSTAMNTRIAAGQKLPDIFAVPFGTSSDKLGKDGVAIDISGLVDEGNAFYLSRLMDMNPLVRAGITSGDGKIYSWPGFGEGIIYSSEDMKTGEWRNPGANVVLYAPAIRQDWLDKVGLPVPKTLDEWHTVLTAFKTKNTSGTGKNIVPMGTLFSYKDLFNFGTAFGIYTTEPFDFKDGKAYCVRTQPEFKELLRYLNTLYTEGLIDPGFAKSDYWNSTVNLINMNLLGAFGGTWDSNLPGYTSNLVTAGVTDANWVPVKTPIDPNGKQQTTNRWSIWKQVVISKDCKNPELALKWLDFQTCSPEGIDLQTYGCEGISYTVDATGKKQLTDYVVNNPDGLGPMEALRAIGAFSQFSNMQTTEFYEVQSPKLLVDFAQSYDKSDVRTPIAGVESFPYSDEELTQISDFISNFNTYVDEYCCGFIDGSIPFDKWDEFVNQINKFGLDNYLNLAQAGYDRFYVNVK